MNNLIRKTLCFLLSLIVILSVSTTCCYCATPSVPKTFSVGLGGTLKIPADISSCSGTTKKWSSTSDVIDVGNSGTVKGLKLGSGTAYCSTEKGEVALCKITVVPAANITLSDNQIELSQNQSYKLNSSVFPSNAIQTVDWISSNDSVASVSSDGTVTAHSLNGTATISCVSQDGTNNKAECTVNVFVKQSTTTSTTHTTKNTTKKVQTTKKKTKPKTTKRQTTQKMSTQSQTKLSTSQKTSYNTTKKETKESTTEKLTTTKKEVVTTGRYIDNDSEITSSQEIDYNNDEYIVTSNGYNLSAISKKEKPIAITWNEISEADGYELYCGKGKNDFYLIYDGKDCSYNKNTYTNGKEYFFYVKAYKFNDNEKIYFDNSEFIEITSVRKSMFHQIFG